MAFSAGFRSRVLIGDFHFSPVLTDFDVPWSTDMLDTTVLTSTAKEFIPGLDTSTFTGSGWLDTDGTANAHFDQVGDWKSATTPEPLTYAPRGLTLGQEVVMVNALESQVSFGSQVGSVVSWSLTGQTDGATDYGVSIKDLAAITSTGNGTGVDLTTVSTTSGAVAHLHVTAFTGFSSVTIVVADSADNSTFATIGSFTAVTGLTSQRLAITGTIRRYVRYAATVTGSGSITFAVSFARR